MGANVWPVDAVSGAPSFNGRALRSAMIGPLSSMGSTMVPLGARSGIRPGTPSAVTSIISTQWWAGPLAGLIATEASTASGVYGYSFDTAQNGVLAPAGSAARIDRLDIQVSDPAEGDGSTTPSIQIVYTQGAATGGATPAAPARSHRLCLISVPASGGGSPSIIWAPDWCAAAGAPWMFNTVAELPSTTVPASQYAVVLADPTPANNTMYVWNGTAWGTPGPFAEAVGVTAISASGGTVSLPVGRFTQPPVIEATVQSTTGNVVAVVYIGSAATTTGFHCAVYTLSGASVAGVVMWRAVQMTPTSAAG